MSAPSTIPTIRAWHIVISGFLQEKGAANGMYSLWRKLHARFTDYETHVALATWNDNHAATAEMIWRSGNGRLPTVKIYAYSWGAGYGAVKLAKELSKRGVPVTAMVLSDPVYRSRLLSFRWLAMIPWRITINNGGIVKWFYQTTNKPAGHELVAGDSRTTIRAPYIVDDGTIHQYMDDFEPFHSACILTAKHEYSKGESCDTYLL